MGGWGGVGWVNKQGDKGKPSQAPHPLLSSFIHFPTQPPTHPRHVRLVQVRPEVVVGRFLKFEHHGGHEGELGPAWPPCFGGGAEDLLGWGGVGGWVGCTSEFFVSEGLGVAQAESF